MKKTPSFSGFVEVRGAREHNLKNVDVRLPRDALVVFTGVSGSGKSSLAFGTLFAEAQRRYLESVAPYARRLFEQTGVPQVDSIDGLPPAVALQQQRGAASTRSSVGSVTTIGNSLRMLFSRAGHYPNGHPIVYAEGFSPNTPEGACPQCHGLGRVYDATERSMVPDPTLTIRQRAIAAWPTAWGGQNQRDILVSLGYDVDRPWRDLSEKDRHWILFTDDRPQVPVYPGYTPAETKAALKRKEPPNYTGTFTSAKRHVLTSFATTHSPLMKRRALRFMIASDCPLCHGKRLKREALAVTFCGLDIADMSRLPLATLAEQFEAIAELRPIETQERPDATARAVDSAPHDKPNSSDRASARAAARGYREWLRSQRSHPERVEVARRIAVDLRARLAALLDLGLGYLTLERVTPTLSPGELQRLRLATQVRSNLFGVVYVLDEPTAGLHPADTEALMHALDGLKAAGNSLFVVEHEIDVIRRADWIVDVGPAAGRHGGRVLYSGPPDGLRDVGESVTRQYLFDETPAHPRTPRPPADWLTLERVTRNNLNGLTVRFPLGLLTSVTGVSGSGKSSLVSQALVELVAARLGQSTAADDDDNDPLDDTPAPTGGRIAGGLDAIDRLVRVDQKPIGRTPRSNLATYTGLFDAVRRVFAATKAAKARRYDAGRFSFNVPKGRCENCEGEGFVFVEMLFLPSVYAPCPVCGGRRYNARTLEIEYRGKTIADVLDLTVDDALTFFDGEPAIVRPLATIRDVGLGYLRLGQPATELSGGEAQRIKLATELQRSGRGRTLYVLDEPTTGLHPADVRRLLGQLDGLASAGNTVVVVEHDMTVIAASDWVIDIGPGAGDRGGTVVAEGPPAAVARVAASRTAAYLTRALARTPA